MKRRAFLALGALAAVPALGASAPYARFHHGLLWRVTRGAAAPNHLYGTIHAADPRVSALPAKAQEAFDHAKSLMLEFVPDGYARERFSQAAFFLDHQTLEQQIGPLDFERAFEQLSATGLGRDYLNRMKPWSVLLNLHARHARHGAAIDERLRELALDRRMPLHQIESVDEQVFTFEEFPMDSQVALLRHSLAHGAELGALAQSTLEAYLAEDLAAIWRLRDEFNARHPEIAAHQAVMTKRVVHDRSVVMAFRMQRELRRGGAFVALGAVHLYGERGVLALLEADGYLVARAS